MLSLSLSSPGLSLSLALCVCLYLSVCISGSLFVCFCLHLSVSISGSLALSVSISVCFSLALSLCFSLSLSLSITLSLSISPSLSISLDPLCLCPSAFGTSHHAEEKLSPMEGPSVIVLISTSPEPDLTPAARQAGGHTFSMAPAPPSPLSSSGKTSRDSCRMSRLPRWDHKRDARMTTAGLGHSVWVALYVATETLKVCRGWRGVAGKLRL